MWTWEGESVCLVLRALFYINRIIKCYGDVFKEMPVNAERTVLMGE